MASRNISRYHRWVARSNKSEVTARLIEKGLRSLPERERAQVTRYLLRSWLDARSSIQPPGTLRRALGEVDPAAVRLAPATGSMAVVPSGVEHQTLPVRLPEEQHARLKEWCNEQGFSMATVIRGLVENFLNAQGGTASR